MYYVIMLIDELIKSPPPRIYFIFHWSVIFGKCNIPNLSGNGNSPLELTQFCLFAYSVICHKVFNLQWARRPGLLALNPKMSGIGRDLNLI